MARKNIEKITSLPGGMTNNKQPMSGFNGRLNFFLIDFTLETIKTWEFDFFYRCLLNYIQDLDLETAEKFLDHVRDRLLEKAKGMKIPILKATDKYKAVLRIQREEQENGVASIEAREQLVDATKSLEKVVENLRETPKV